MATPTDAAVSDPTPDTPDNSAPGSGTESPDVAAKLAEFAELKTAGEPPASSPLDSLLSVTVTVSAELGRRTMPIAEVLKLGIGSVLELDRAVFEPVDLVAQGVRLARGEVVVVDDRFAVRIKEIADPKKRT